MQPALTASGLTPFATGNWWPTCLTTLRSVVIAGIKRQLDGIATLDGLAAKTTLTTFGWRSSMLAATRRGPNRYGATQQHEEP
jgi:hypothetical protein